MAHIDSSPTDDDDDNDDDVPPTIPRAEVWPSNIVVFSNFYLFHYIELLKYVMEIVKNIF
jgi:hypothetical protein